jgi:mycothiol system anti-sigma-R factor
MLCDDVKRVVYFFLDGTLSSSKHRDIEIHVSDCPGCTIRVSVQRRLRSFVKSRLSPVAAPDSLRIRVSQSLRTPATLE